MPSHFKVKEYCPLVFRNLRERFNIDDVDYRESLTGSQPILIDSAGKSGAQFYQSFDKFFIIKSLTSEEVERMHSFLKHYHPVSKKTQKYIKPPKDGSTNVFFTYSTLLSDMETQNYHSI